MRAAPLLIAFAIAAGLVGFSTLHGQPPVGKTEKGAAAELERFRGDWVITKIEPPPGQPAPPSEALQGLTFEVRDNRVTIVNQQGGFAPRRDHALLNVDPVKSPAHIDLTDATSKFEPRKTFPTARTPGKEYLANEPIVGKGIYKFEGDALVLALPTDPQGERPAEFKAAAPKDPNGSRAERYGVGLVYLTKKK